jgi:allantoicase
VTGFTDLVDLAAERLGGAATLANDEFFAAKENLVKPGRGVWIDDKYTEQGKWMDGWETRRRRTPGHDWCVVRLGIPGIVRGVDVDTNHFRGNYPEACSIDARSDGGDWVEILPKSKLSGHAQNLFEVRDGRLWSEVRLNIHPDGGVARLRVYGEVVPPPLAGTFDLASVRNGGAVIAASDEFFGSRRNLILPDDPINMGDGWETRRRRGPGHDWVVVRLAAESTPERVEVDTAHFKGNYPGSCWLEGSVAADGPWTSLLPQSELGPDRRHAFEVQPAACRFVRLSIHPDGGVARLRLFGTLTAAGFLEARTRCLDALPRDAAVAHLLRICGSRRWAERVAEKRPFASPGALLGAADSVWREMGRDDWLEAFRAHPRIGEKGTGWSQKEQKGALQAGAAALAELSDLNAAYESRFGHVFLICASGRTAEEILAEL